MSTIGREIQTDIAFATAREWLLTNGIGGFACSTVSCINTRRYHGLLVASMRPPVERSVLVSRIEEIVVINGREINLSTCLCKKKILNPAGYLHIERFERDPLPTWYYQINDIMIIKTISMVYGQNTTLITYKVLSPDKKISIKLIPHFLFRDFHGNSHANDGAEIDVSVDNNSLTLQPFKNAPVLYLRWDRGTFTKDKRWHKDILLKAEQERRLDEYEDDFSSGIIEVEDFAGSVSLIFSDKQISSFNPVELRKKEENRLETIANSLNSSDELLKTLLLAADQFIVERKSTSSKTILAGYPWFSDWGRDSLISLPGLTLVTGRFEDAKSILKTFAGLIKRGMIPNCFADVGSDAMYNSVDASLWFFIAAYKFIEYTDDYKFCKDNLFEGMDRIIEAFINGTLYCIKMDQHDNLLSAGDKDTQLTWMDAKVDDVPVTPRYGKAVEINALWYNALKIYALFQEKFEGHSRDITSLARKVKASFEKTFWNNRADCLYDCIAPDGKQDDSLRPNQIFAVSLPFELLDSNREKLVVNKIFEQLYVSYGLRTLPPSDARYCGFYSGGRKERDNAYHQGTAWGFMIGPFISSWLKVNNYSMSTQLRASYMIEAFKNHLVSEGCIGTVSEVFDGNMPHSPGGCFAQAWSVAELLRCYVEDIKGQKPVLVI